MTESDYEKILSFASQHRNEDSITLLLQQKRYPDIDLKMVAQQLEGIKQAAAKWPKISTHPKFWYPPHINREQSSSEQTAQHKAQLFVANESYVCDMTGGMGIDTLLAAERARHIDYIEQTTELCDNMRHNIKTMGVDNIDIYNADSIAWVTNSDRLYDTIYIDPARRNENGKRVAAFANCTPNLLPHLATILLHCNRLVIKASPMIDINTACVELGESLHEIHIVSIDNECKEVLFACQKERCHEPKITCCDMHHNGTTMNELTFTKHEEETCDAIYATYMERYLYEPNVTILKGGLFKALTLHYKCKKIDRNSHLYTSAERIDDFPGRDFEILQEVALNAKETAAAIRQYDSTQQNKKKPRAHIITRNYPVTAANLQQQLKIDEGGSLFIIATTCCGKRKGYVCRRCTADNAHMQ